MKIKVQHVERWRDRHGKERLYYRRYPGPRVALRGPEGSDEFWEDYNVAKDKPAVSSGKRGTMRWLVIEYYKSAAYKQLSRRTQRVRRGILDRFSAEHGHKRYAQLKPKHLRRIRDKMIEKPEAANGMLKALGQVFKYAVEYEYVDNNPVTDIERLKSKNKDGFHAWTLDEVEQYENKHPVGTKPRLALALLLYTGQRRGDIVKMGRQHVKDDWMNVTQQKTKKRIEIPVLSELRRIIEASPTGDLTYLVTHYNKAFTSNGFGNWFRKQCDAAGLKQCSAHGLRKAAASRLAELGCSTREIMSITGHESLQEVERYTKAANQKTLAGRVRDKIDGQNGNIPPNPNATLPPNSEKVEQKQ